jgi:hypothetical protein
LRREEEAMPGRPNFYQILDLDPAVEDWETIEKKIRDKQLHWAKDSNMGSPKVRREAKRNLGFLAEIRRVLADPASRQKEAEEARSQERAAHAAEEQKLTEWIGVLKSAGTCNEEQLQKLISEFEGIFSEQEIGDRLTAAGIRRVQAGPEEPRRRGPRESLNVVTARNLRRNLEHLGLGSLYEFLREAPSSAAEVLRKRADQILKENQRLGQTDTQTSAASELAGTCIDLFRDEAGKARYDNFRLLEVLESIKLQIELAASDGMISPEEMRALIHLAEQRGLSAADARDVIAEHAEEKGWTIQREVVEKPPPPRDVPDAVPVPAPRPTGPSVPVPSPDRNRFARSMVGMSVVAAAIVFFFYFGGPIRARLFAPAAPPIPPAGGPPTPGSSSAPPSGGGGAAAPSGAGTSAGAATGSAGASVETPPPPPKDKTGGASPPSSLASASSPGKGSSVQGSAALSGLAVAPPPPRIRQPLPENPVVAVLATGDPLLSGAVEDRLQSDLRSAGLEVRDSGIERSEGERVELTSVLPTLASSGVHVLVLARVESLGHRDLSYYGRHDVAYKARVRLSILNVADQRSLGSVRSEDFDYTAVNGAGQAGDAVQAVSGELIEALRYEWRAGR